MELDRLVREATAALTVLDADALEELAGRAQSIGMMSLGLGMDGKKAVPALAMRVRSLDALLKLTGENLTTLERASGRGSFGREVFGYAVSRGLVADSPGVEQEPVGLFQSFGLYGDANGRASIWPRAHEAGVGSERAGRA